MSPQEQQDFLDAVKTLTNPQKLTLYNFSAKLLEGTRYSSGMDLLHEVIDRVLSGSRKWDRSVPIGAFLYECMRSVLSVEWRRPSRRPASYEEWMESGTDDAREAENEFACSPEELLMKRQEEEIRRSILDATRKRLAHNKNAQDVLGAIEEDMTPAEARKALGIGERAYKAAREQIAKDIRTHNRGPRR